MHAHNIFLYVEENRKIDHIKYCLLPVQEVFAPFDILKMKNGSGLLGHTVYARPARFAENHLDEGEGGGR